MHGGFQSALIDIDRATEFTGDDVDRYSELVDLGQVFSIVTVEIPTIDSASIYIYVQKDKYKSGVPIPVHYMKSDDTTAVLANTAGTGGNSITLLIGGYQFIRIYTTANQTADRTFYVRGVA